MNKYSIEHVRGGMWLTQHNFSNVKEQAIRFDTEDDAKEYLRTAGLGKEHNVVPMAFDNEGLGLPGQAVTEYHPHATPSTVEPLIARPTGEDVYG